MPHAFKQSEKVQLGVAAPWSVGPHRTAQFMPFDPRYHCDVTAVMGLPDRSKSKARPPIPEKANVPRNVMLLLWRSLQNRVHIDILR